VSYGETRPEAYWRNCLSRFLTNSIGGSCAIALIQPLALDRGYLFWPATGHWRRPDAMEAEGPGS
jgi:hypothetical protein